MRGLVCALALGLLTAACGDSGSSDAASDTDSGGGNKGGNSAGGKSDSDVCPGTSVTPEGKAQHCCERASSQPDAPGFKLTGLSMSTPPVFGNAAVSQTNKDAIETDRYNWVMQLSGKGPGDITIGSGLGLLNEDGTYSLVDGPFELGGQTWNQGGEWSKHEIPGEVTQGTNGGHLVQIKNQYVPEAMDRVFQLPMWGNGFDYTMLVLSMSGIQMSIEISDDWLCGGYIDADGKFDLVGTLTSYLPLEPTRTTVLHLAKGDSGTALCPLTAQIKPEDCTKPVSEWSAKDGMTIIYPDSICDKTACKWNDPKGEPVCDGDGKNAALPDCNAWQIKGTFGLQAVRMSEG